MEGLTYKDINQRVLPILANPGRNYYLCLLLCVAGTLIGGACWAYQFFTGVGAMGLNHPVMWGTDLINFVFWIEIGHAGSMMSALLYLLRAKWRSPIARMAETMTVFAVAVAGLFPFYHLGRGWIAYWIFPYPNQRNLWPNLQSPLVFDNIAVAGYFVISLAFLFIGSVPDIALARDHSTGWRRKFYGVLSLGWVGSHRQWRPFKSAYLFFAFLTMAFGILRGQHRVLGLRPDHCARISQHHLRPVFPGWGGAFGPGFSSDPADPHAPDVPSRIHPHPGRAGKNRQNHHRHHAHAVLCLYRRIFHGLVRAGRRPRKPRSFCGPWASTACCSGSPWPPAWLRRSCFFPKKSGPAPPGCSSFRS